MLGARVCRRALRGFVNATGTVATRALIQRHPTPVYSAYPAHVLGHHPPRPDATDEKLGPAISRCESIFPPEHRRGPAYDSLSRASACSPSPFSARRWTSSAPYVKPLSKACRLSFCIAGGTESATAWRRLSGSSIWVTAAKKPTITMLSTTLRPSSS